MFPLQTRTLIRGCAAHKVAGLGCGADYKANYVPFFIPFDGVAEKFSGTQGGNWLRITRADGVRAELAHLSKYSVNNGKVRTGQLGGVTGNTGTVTDYPHLHIQLFDKAGNRLDPEKFNWQTNITTQTMQLVKDKGTVYILTGNNDKRKIGIADPVALGLFGDEPQKEMDTSGIPQYNTIASNGIVISSN